MVTLGTQVPIVELMGNQGQAATHETPWLHVPRRGAPPSAAPAAHTATSLNAVKSRYNQNNKIILVCFILASGLLAPSLVAGDSTGAPGAGAPLASKQSQDLPKTAVAVSVVRVGKNGHLVRALEAPGPANAKGTVQVTSDLRTRAMIRQTVRRAEIPAATATPAAARPPAQTLHASPQSHAASPITIPASTASPADVAQLIDETASAYAVDPLLVRSVMGVESNFNPQAVSPKGAQGLMQLIPATARRFGVSDPFDVRQNIEGGVKYLHYLQGLFPGDLRLSLAAYNAGEGAVTRFGDVPPYPETVDYVAKVKQRYNQAQQGRNGDSHSAANGTSTTAAGQLNPAQPSGAATDASAAVPVRHIEQYTDSEGRLYLRTR